MCLRRWLLGHFEAVVMSVSLSGELAYELHIPNQQLLGVYDLLRQHGEPMSISGFGMYALESMRMEKAYGHWKAA